MLFGLAPRLTESVAWISGRTDVLAGLFALSAILLHRAGPGGEAWRAASAAALLAGLLCKEVAIAAVPAIVAGRLASGTGRDWRTLVRESLPLGAALVVYGILRLSAMRDVPPSAASFDLPRRAVSGLEAIGRYVSMLADPFRPRLQIGLLTEPAAGFVALGAVALLGSIATGWIAVRRRWPAPVVEALVLAASALALVLHVIPIRLNVVAADRFLYLPLAGIAIALASAAGRLPRRGRRIASAIALAGSCASFVATHVRAGEWADEERLWRVAVATTPEARNCLPRAELGNVLFRAGRYGEALDVYRAALPDADSVERLTLLSNIASTQSELGDYDGAGATMLQVLDHGGKAPIDWLNLAVIELRRLDFDAGERALAQAIALHPDYPQALALRARLPELRAEASALPPESAAEEIEVSARRAALFARLGRDRDATRVYASIADDPRASSGALMDAARYLASRGNLRLAERALGAATTRGADGGEVEALRSALRELQAAQGQP